MDFAESFILMGTMAVPSRYRRGRPLFAGLGLYHGKRGFGVSVEAQVRNGPVTILGLTQTQRVA